MSEIKELLIVLNSIWGISSTENEIQVDCGYGRNLMIKYVENYYLIVLNDDFKKYINQSNILSKEYLEGNKKIYKLDEMEKEINQMKNLSAYLHRVWEGSF